VCVRRSHSLMVLSQDPEASTWLPGLGTYGDFCLTRGKIDRKLRRELLV
jgi:hypothetical protein